MANDTLPIVNKVREWLKGKKTYIAAIGGVALGISMLTEGDFQGGALTIVGALGLSGLRAGVQKAQDAADPA